MKHILLIAALCAPCSGLRAEESPWKARVEEVQKRPEYRHAHWGMLVADLKTGDVLYEQNSDKLFAPASVTKLFSVSAAWREFGPDHRFRTSIYRAGEVVDGGRLEGDLIFRAAGDLTLGGRTGPDGRIAFRNGDHTYANGNSTAQITDEDPLAGVKSLARQVADSGIRRITGDVLVDDRLFDVAASTGSGPGRVSAVILNDNVLDAVITATEPGQPASVATRPDFSFVRVDAQVETVEADAKPAIRFFWGGPGRVVLRGQVPAGKPPLVKVLEWSDSEFVLRGR